VFGTPVLGRSLLPDLFPHLLGYTAVSVSKMRLDSYQLPAGLIDRNVSRVIIQADDARYSAYFQIDWLPDGRWLELPAMPSGPNYKTEYMIRNDKPDR
jgi:hypothetical protein